jgi:hypothetical protein
MTLRRHRPNVTKASDKFGSIRARVTLVPVSTRLQLTHTATAEQSPHTTSHDERYAFAIAGVASRR